MLSVRDLLEGLDVDVLAGEHGLDLPVRWVHISELTDPTPWLSGGELLLTTGLQLTGETRQREFVARLADHHLSGLGFGTGFAHQQVPAPVLEAAAARDFPVFEVPYELPFIAVTEAAFTQLVNEQYAVLRRALAAQERLERIVLSQRGLEALAGALASLIGAAVVVFDARGEPLVQRAFRRPVDADLLAALRSQIHDRVRHREVRAFVPALPDATGVALPVSADGASGGAITGDGVDPGFAGRDGALVAEAWLVAIKDTGPLSDFDRLTLHQAVTIVALELLRTRVAGDTERRLAGDILAAIVAGELDGVELARRLAPFGLPGPVAAIVVAPASNGSDGGEATGEAKAQAALSAALREQAVRGLVARAGPLTCALVGGAPEEELFSLGERLATALTQALGDHVRIGVGRAVPAAEARRSFHEARCALEGLALEPARATNGASAARVATYKNLGSSALLLSLQDNEALGLFCDSILGPIERSEGPYGGELMRSLEIFIEENGQWERAARRLYCHRHTLRYRIRRVEELTGRDLSNARDRIEFWLALRGRNLVS